MTHATFDARQGVRKQILLGAVQHILLRRPIRCYHMRVHGRPEQRQGEDGMGFGVHHPRLGRSRSRRHRETAFENPVTHSRQHARRECRHHRFLGIHRRADIAIIGMLGHAFEGYRICGGQKRRGSSAVPAGQTFVQSRTYPRKAGPSAEPTKACFPVYGGERAGEWPKPCSPSTGMNANTGM